MATAATKTYLVTGANSGLGFDASRQLALMEHTKKVYLACRTESKALAAIDGLVNGHSIPRDKLAFAPFDASDSKEEIIQKIVDVLPSSSELKFDGLVFNAGGNGSDGSGKPAGPNNVLNIVQINVLAHIHFLDALKTKGFLIAGSDTNDKTRIVYSGSEASRGVPSMGLKSPQLPDTVEEYKALMDGSGYDTYDGMVAYATTKGLAALYFSAWARHNPEYFALTVSPGGTSGTAITSQDSGSYRITQLFMAFMMNLMRVFGATHSVEVGAKRYVDGVTGQGDFTNFSSGAFVASVKTATGKVGDQTEYPEDGAQYGDKKKQDAMYEAMQSHM